MSVIQKWSINLVPRHLLAAPKTEKRRKERQKEIKKEKAKERKNERKEEKKKRKKERKEGTKEIENEREKRRKERKNEREKEGKKERMKGKKKEGKTERAKEEISQLTRQFVSVRKERICFLRQKEPGNNHRETLYTRQRYTHSSIYTRHLHIFGTASQQSAW